jgi:hypothetical protein
MAMASAAQLAAEMNALEVFIMVNRMKVYYNIREEKKILEFNPISKRMK